MASPGVHSKGIEVGLDRFVVEKKLKLKRLINQREEAQMCVARFKIQEVIEWLPTVVVETPSSLISALDR